MDAEGQVFEYGFNPLGGVVLLFFAGFVSGFLGVGGGIVVVPAYTLVLGVPIHIAVATSMFAMIFTALSGFSTHLQLGNVISLYAVALIPGIIFGSQIGARLAKSLRGRMLERVFGTVVLLSALWMIISRLMP